MKRSLVLLSAMAFFGCERATEGSDLGASDAFVYAPYTLPDGAPGRFGIGAEASEARVAAWDTDVKPDGEGLPVGSGTVAEGEVVFRTYCMPCHGPTGTEGPNDVLVGSDPWEAWPGSVTVGGVAS